MAEFHVNDAATFDGLLDPATGTATDGDHVFVDSDLAGISDFFPGDGVKVIGGKVDGTRSKLTGGTLNNVTRKGIDQPDRIWAEGLDLTGPGIELWDCTRAMLKNIYVHGMGGDATFFRGYDRDDVSITVENGLLSDVGADGYDLSLGGGGGASNINKSIITLINCNAFDNVGYTGGASQAATAHDGGQMNIDGGRWVSQGDSVIAAASGADATIIVRNAQIVGVVKVHRMENCTLDGNNGTSSIYARTGVQSGMLDCYCINVNAMTAFGGGDFHRIRMVKGTGNSQLWALQGVSQNYSFHSCEFWGNGGTSNRVWQSNGAANAQTIEILNCTCINFGSVVDWSVSEMTTSSIYHSLFLDCIKWEQADGAGTKNGDWNYRGSMTAAGFSNYHTTYDSTFLAFARSLVNSDGEILSGDGASAMPFRDYANGDFVLDLTGDGEGGQTVHKITDWGDLAMAPATRAMIDLTGVAFDRPTIGCRATTGRGFTHARRSGFIGVA